VIGRILANGVTHLRDDAGKLLGWPVAIAAMLGLAAAIRTGSVRRLWSLLAAGALLFLSLVPVFHSERYSLALLPFYATLAATAFASPVLALGVGRSRRVWLKPILAFVMVAALLPAFLRRHAFNLGQLPVEAVEAGETLRRLRRPGDKLIARKPHVAYYGGVAPLAFPFADSLSQLARYAHREHARWLFMSWPEAETRPAFFHLLDTSGVVPGLRPRYVASPRPAVLYEIGPEFGIQPDWFADDTLFLWHTLRASTMIQPGNVELRVRLGWLSWFLGRLPEAKRHLLVAARLDPNRSHTFLTLGRALLAMGEPEEARQAFGRARQLEPRNAAARLGLGMAALLAGRDREAADAWRDVIAETADPRMLRTMASLYDSLGDAAAAARARERLALMGSP
jgi:tetratricopeptide (TPR) repeat protein